MSSDSLSDYAAFAAELADAARAAIAVASRDADDKGGGAFDPVTEADRAAERAMRALIGARYPDHGIAGEEYGVVRGDARFVWSLDPIDGTRSFICGLPSWTTLIALVEEGAATVGLIDAPALDERYSGFGRMARLNGEALATSGCATLAEARFSTTDPYLFAGAEAEGFERLRRATRVARYGLDAYAYARVAAGGLDLVVESGLKPHDYNALGPVVRGAGGFFGNWEGGDDLSAGRVVAAASERLFEDAVALLQD
ncbi:inositol monophosphatase family protein [Sphingosinicella sp. LHD-64]|uniref:inositol monophosphatase family protein n=1 Tax=Sphingosinicella sp. LHD-64 TaxID=3072139 RepID=UPI00280FEDF0|nr:inositol monophosphatase family protein [Sphingosinicella sp. LHD-64]MDQ8755578.1 inositol monophosphatase family protein [Sphingosinicella sp. LHD-64]